MPSWNQIQQTNKEELTKENKKIVNRLVLTKIVAPVVIMTAVHYGVEYLFNRLDQNSED